MSVVSLMNLVDVKTHFTPTSIEKHVVNRRLKKQFQLPKMGPD
jgi:hypothetical protein